MILEGEQPLFKQEEWKLLTHDNRQQLLRLKRRHAYPKERPKSVQKYNGRTERNSLNV